jgi:hypothetical protein
VKVRHPTDFFGHTPAAENDRAAKAKVLASFLWDRALTGSDLAGMPDDRRRSLARAAGVNPPSDHKTWDAVERLLERQEGWARANPDHPRAAHPLADLRGDWTSVAPQPPETAVVESGAAEVPKGWLELAALGPRKTGVCYACRKPALVGTFDRLRCAEHPPQAGEWGVTMDWTPNPSASCAPNRCTCGRCDGWAPA